jgi:hypothetical protein
MGFSLNCFVCGKCTAPGDEVVECWNAMSRLAGQISIKGIDVEDLFDVEKAGQPVKRCNLFCIPAPNLGMSQAMSGI